MVDILVYHFRYIDIPSWGTPSLSSAEARRDANADTARKDENMITRMKALAGIVTVLFIATMLAAAYGLTANFKVRKTLNVGTVTVDIVGSRFAVTYAIEGADTSNLYLLETHLAVAFRLSDIPRAQTGDPIPGRFNYTREYAPPDTSTGTGGKKADIYTLSLKGASRGFTIYIAVHANVGQFAWGDWDSNPATPETYGLALEITSWGQGTPFPGAIDPAMYFTCVLPS